MPRETFKHLSNEKQQAILEAAKKEFSLMSFHEASINKIIKDAGISRGSFYMYFEDKEDLYYTITEHEFTDMLHRISKLLTENDGDLFITYRMLYDKILSSKKETAEQLHRKFLLNLNFKSDQLVLQKMNKHHKQDIEVFLTKVDMTNLNVRTKQDIFDLFDMLNLLLVHALVLTIKHGNDIDKIKNRYFRQIDFIMDGIKKGR